MDQNTQAPQTGRQRNRWLVGSSMLAAAAASLTLLPSAAYAQAAPGGPGDTNSSGIAVNASANYNASEVSYFSDSSNAQVDVFVDSAIINWTTDVAGTPGGEVTFLDAGNQLTFTSMTSDFTVLNRIFTPTADAAVRIDGTVIGELNLGSVTEPGGSIWFYSPGGLIIGSTATFDVGSLVLTSSDLNSISPTLDFTGVMQTDSAVVIESGAQISALQQNSYFAVVAPRVVQGGTVDVNGSVAYVAAEQAQLTINNGLFDIAVGLGSADTNGVVHTGTTTGAAATPTVDGFGQITDADARAIHMVAVPKNTAISMLVGGSVGYQPAMAAALADNGSIILSSGAGTVTGGTFDMPTVEADFDNAVAGGSVVLNTTAFESTAEIFASDTVTLAASGTDVISSGSDGRGAYDLTIAADNGIDVSLQDNGTIDIAGNFGLKSGGPIDLDLTSVAGIFSVGGDLFADTSAFGADDIGTIRNNGGTGIGVDSAAGSIMLTVGGGTNFTINGNLELAALAQGGLGENQSGASTGGDVTVNFNSTGSTFVGASLVLDSQALAAQDGKDLSSGIGLVGSDSTAGDVTLNLGGASLAVGGLFMDASADASAGDGSATAQSNDATAGTVSVNVTGGNNQFGDVTLVSQANGAESFDNAGSSITGSATRGLIEVDVTNSGSILDVTTDFLIDATTDGATSQPATETVSIMVDGVGLSGGMQIGGQLAIDTISGGGLNTGTTTAGSVLIDVTDGGLTSSSLNIAASASPTGRDISAGGGSGQDFQGGDVTVRANADGSIGAESVFILADATGALNTGGDATGGAITIDANDGAIAFQVGASLVASAAGGASIDPADGNVGVARGGDLIVSVSGPNGALNLGNLSLATDASIAFDPQAGSNPFSGDGGSAVAGAVTFTIDGGNLTANSMSISSLGLGGNGGTLPPAIVVLSTGLPAAGDGGSGQGGTVTFDVAGGDAMIADLSVTADGVGGAGANGDFDVGTRSGAGGGAIGGTVVFNALSGSLTTGSLTVSAEANPGGSGGAGGFGEGSEGGAGGDATGGSATFNLTGTAVITAGSVQVSTDGIGGDGGGSGVLFGSGPPVDGSDAGHGGIGTGGASVFNHTSGTMSFTDLTSSAQGTGGAGGDSFGFSFGDSTGAAGAGGDGIGGIATINLNQDDGSSPTYSVNANALGGAGGVGLSSGDGGAATGGLATLAINDAAIVLNSAAISANAVGGDAGSSDTAGGTSGAGGSGIGGTASLEITGPTASLTSASPVQILATATGGSGADGAFGGGATVNGDNGGIGGSAVGGTAGIELTGAGAALTVNSLLANLSSDAFGGRGGSAGATSNATGGTGGFGGDATGGSVTLQANSGTTLTLDEGSGPLSLSSTGIGGNGGFGGTAFSTGSVAGIGGDGGTGVGGSPALRAIGGTITGSDVTLSSFGFGGSGSAGGNGPLGVPAATGNGGNAQGGNPIMELLDGSPGIISLGNVNIIALGTAGAGTLAGSTIGGRVDISDLSPTVGGVFSFDSLSVTVFGDVASVGGGFFFDAGSGTNTITALQTIDVVGDISYTFDGDGQLDVGDATQLTATGDILISHTNNTGPVISFANGGDFDAVAGADFVADGQSIIASDADILIRAEGNAQAHDLQAFSNIDFSAGQNAMVDNALVTGPPQTSPIGAGFIVTNGISIRAGGDDDPSFELYDPMYNATITGDVTSTGFVSVIAGGNAVFGAASSTVSDNGLTVRTGDDIIIGSGALVEAGANLTNPIDPLLPFADFNNLVLDAGALVRSGELSGTPLTPLASIVSAGDIAANNFAVTLNANAIDGLGGTISAGSIQADIVDAPNAGLPQDDDAGLLSTQCLAGNICLGSISADNRLEVGQSSNNDVIQLTVDQGAIAANNVLITIREDIAFGSIGAPTTLNAANTFAIESLTGDVTLIDTAINSDQITISAAGSLLGNGALTSTSDIGITVGEDVNALLIATGGQLTDALNIGGAFETEYVVKGAIDVATYTQGANAPVRIVAGEDNSFGAINVPLTEDITLIAGDVGLGPGIGDVSLGAATGARNIALTGNNVGFGDLAAEQSAVFSAVDGDVTGGSLTSGGALDLSGDAITVGALTAGGILTVDAAVGSIVTGAIDGSDAVSLTAGGDITTDVISAGGSAIASAIGALTFVSADASGVLDFFAGDAIAATGAISASEVALDSRDSVSAASVTATDAAGSGIDISGSSGITVGSLTGNAGLLEAAVGPIAITDDIDVSGVLEANGQSVFLRSTNALTVVADASAGGVDIVTTGDLDLRGITASGNIDLTSGGALDTLQIVSSGGAVNMIAADDLSVSSDVSASGALTIEAGGLLDLDAGASGATIDVQIGDINISTLGSLGRSDETTSIVIATAGDAVLGGAGGGSLGVGGLELSNDEFARIFSGGDLSISAQIDQMGAGGNITVDTLDASAATGNGTAQDGNIGQGSEVFLGADASIDVIGVGTMTTADVGTAFVLDAEDAIRVDPASGALFIEDANGDLSGELRLIASQIEAISETARMDIDDAVTAAEIDTRLGENDGAINDIGYFSAADISFTADDVLLIQNSGAGTEFDDRRGFTANTVTIDTEDSDTLIVINGTVDGVTGFDTIAELDLPADFAPGSTVNGCLILNIASCGDIPEVIDPEGPSNPSLRNPIQDLIDRDIVPSDSEIPETGDLDDPEDSDEAEESDEAAGPIEAEEADDQIFMKILRDMRRAATLREDPLLDEPVTGAGNEDLWGAEVE